MMAVGSNDFYKELKKLINIPDHCTGLVIRMYTGSMVEIIAEFYAEKGSGEKITKTYNLVEAKESHAVSMDQEGKNANPGTEED